MSASTLEQIETRPAETDSDGKPRFTHIVYPKGPLTDAIINGTPVTALCGHTWVPGRDPQRYPICSRCREIFEAIHGPMGDDIQ